MPTKLEIQRIRSLAGRKAAKKFYEGNGNLKAMTEAAVRAKLKEQMRDDPILRWRYDQWVQSWTGQEASMRSSDFRGIKKGEGRSSQT